MINIRMAEICLAHTGELVLLMNYSLTKKTMEMIMKGTGVFKEEG